MPSTKIFASECINNNLRNVSTKKTIDLKTTQKSQQGQGRRIGRIEARKAKVFLNLVYCGVGSTNDQTIVVDKESRTICRKRSVGFFSHGFSTIPRRVLSRHSHGNSCSCSVTRQEQEEVEVLQAKARVKSEKTLVQEEGEEGQEKRERCGKYKGTSRFRDRVMRLSKYS